MFIQKGLGLGLGRWVQESYVLDNFCKYNFFHPVTFKVFMMLLISTAYILLSFTKLNDRLFTFSLKQNEATSLVSGISWYFL